jgi:hypothetical protein
VLVNLFKKEEKPLEEKLKKDAAAKVIANNEKFKHYKASRSKEPKKEKLTLANG